MILTGKGKKHSRQDREKQLFFLILILSFFAILVFNVLTPMLSDDYAYAMEVQKAGSLADLFRQEYHQYMTWNGRSVVHFILRVFLFLPSWVFKLANSAAFVAVSLLMWKLTEPDREYDCYTLLMVQLGLWLYAVDFSETILWEDGACNYLWGALLILLFMAMERRTLVQQASFHLSEALGLLLLGILAGWCNENTSGGCLLYLLILAAEEIRKNTKSRKGRGEENSRKKRSEGAIPAAYLVGLCGNILGLAMMVLSPGGRLRASYAEEENYQDSWTSCQSAEDYIDDSRVFRPPSCSVCCLSGPSDSSEESHGIQKDAALSGPVSGNLLCVDGHQTDAAEGFLRSWSVPDDRTDLRTSGNDERERA